MHTNKLRISVIKFEGLCTKHTNTRECTKIFGARIYFYPIFCVGMKILNSSLFVNISESKNRRSFDVWSMPSFYFSSKSFIFYTLTCEFILVRKQHQKLFLCTTVDVLMIFYRIFAFSYILYISFNVII